LLPSLFVRKAKKNKADAIFAPAPREAGPAARPAAHRGSSSGRAATLRRPADPPRRAKAEALSAEALLERAMHAKTPRSRAIWARRGLALKGPIDRTTQSMLLRQLYLTHFEGRRFARAMEVAEQMIELAVLPDVAHQEMARACYAAGSVDQAVGHLRLAARIGPPARKAFHWWTLGSVYFLAGRPQESISSLTRAARWGTTDKPLYQGHLAVVRCAAGEKVPGLGALIDRLAEVPAGQGYGRFVLGHLAYHDGQADAARRWLSAFIKRSTGGRVALSIALEGEVAMARRTLASLGASPGEG
jgi:tetratricopeptide (TPR) repeat protein